MNTVDYDVALFESITSLLNEQRRAVRSERRENERYPYRCVQLVAAFDGENLPEQQQFRHVMCHDLSPGGFSFYSSSPPEHRYLIVSLGKVPKIKFFLAKVVRVNPVQQVDGCEYHVGCQFLRRLMAE